MLNSEVGVILPTYGEAENISKLGTAITDGFKIVLSAKQPPKYVFTMDDADYAHNPQDIPKLLATIRECDCGIVIGSRYVKRGRIAGWPFTRKIISKTANLVARASSGLKLNDYKKWLSLLLYKNPQRSQWQLAQPHL